MLNSQPSLGCHTYSPFYPPFFSSQFIQVKTTGFLKTYTSEQTLFVRRPPEFRSSVVKSAEPGPALESPGVAFRKLPPIVFGHRNHRYCLKSLSTHQDRTSGKMSKMKRLLLGKWATFQNKPTVNFVGVLSSFSVPLCFFFYTIVQPKINHRLVFAQFNGRHWILGAMVCFTLKLSFIKVESLSLLRVCEPCILFKFLAHATLSGGERILHQGTWKLFHQGRQQTTTTHAERVFALQGMSVLALWRRKKVFPWESVLQHLHVCVPKVTLELKL